MSEDRKHPPFAGTVSVNSWQISDAILQTRIARAIDAGESRYPIFRSLRFAARVGLEELFDAIATSGEFAAQRPSVGLMLLDAPGVYVVAHGGRASSYCSCSFQVWADSLERAVGVIRSLEARVENERVREPMFSIDWNFLTGRGELESASIEELADDVLLDEAYPEIPGGVGDFIERYLDADESVLVVRGPPGTGKTRLIRAILGAMARRKHGSLQVLYTGDKKTLESDQIYVNFITGWHDAFVVEDADHLLRPRAEGNEHLHRFLAIADGVVRAQGRKIIFSTNLPNVGDLDDALVRPGRCFANLLVRSLSAREAQRVVQSLCGDDDARDLATRAIAARSEPTITLAEVYRLAKAPRGEPA